MTPHAEPDPCALVLAGWLLALLRVTGNPMAYEISIPSYPGTDEHPTVPVLAFTKDGVTRYTLTIAPEPPLVLDEAALAQLERDSHLPPKRGHHP